LETAGLSAMTARSGQGRQKEKGGEFFEATWF